MEQMLEPKQKILILSITLFLLVSGCSAQQTSTFAFTTSVPSPQVIPTSSFGIGDIASVARKDVATLSSEDIVKVLIGQWLEGYKTDSFSKEAIVDYKVEQVFIKQKPTDTNPEIVAGVTFSVEPKGYSDNWATLSKDVITENAKWWRLGGIFSVVLDGEYYKLRTAFGWGT